MSVSNNAPYIGAILLCIAVIYHYVVYPIFLSPLSRIPNAHFTCGTSPIWILMKRHQGRENRDVLAAHKKYGPVLRIAPNELSVNGVEGGLRTIYGGGFEKGEWYKVFDNYGYDHSMYSYREMCTNFRSTPCMFSTASSKQHSALKKMMSNVYSKTYISSSPAVHKQTDIILKDRLLPLLATAADDNTPLEVVEVYHSTTMDMITAFLFGLRCSSNFLKDIDFRREWLHTYHTAKKYLFWVCSPP